MPGKAIYDLCIGGATFPIPEKTLLQKIPELKDSKANWRTAAGQRTCLYSYCRRTKFSKDEIKKYVKRSGRNPEKEKKKKRDRDLPDGFSRSIYNKYCKQHKMPIDTQTLLDKFEDLEDCTASFANWDSQRQAMFAYIKKHGHQPEHGAQVQVQQGGQEDQDSAANSAFKEFYTNYMGNLKASDSEPDGKKRRKNTGEAWQESLDNPNLGRNFFGKNNKTRNFGQNSSAKEYKDAKAKRVVNMRQNRTSKKAKLVKGNEAAAANFEV